AGAAADAAASLPPRERWPSLDPLRGALVVEGGTRHVRGVPFTLLPRDGVQGVRLGDSGMTLEDAAAGDLVHVLAVPTSARARVRAADRVASPTPCAGTSRTMLFTVQLPAAPAPLVLRADDCVVLAVTRESPRPPGTPDVRVG